MDRSTCFDTGQYVGKSQLTGFNIFLIMVLTLSGCSGKSLQPWHTERLSEDFRARDQGKINTFEEYQRQEDRVFQ